MIHLLTFWQIHYNARKGIVTALHKTFPNDYRNIIPRIFDERNPGVE